MSTHACTVDYSRETGSLVVCTCGFVLGPLRDKANAVAEATPEQRERHNASQRAKRAAARAARESA